MSANTSETDIRDDSMLQDFLKSRDAALLSGSIPALRAHLKRFGAPDADTAPDKVLEISLHKSRVHWRDCPPEKLKESVWWLLDRDYDLML
ncbi:MAG: hypothetical protein IKP40_13945 [Clostridia bacterium]|nr:hypothetical protein [Clostridia bacterium]